MQNNKGKKQYILNRVVSYFRHIITTDQEAEAAIKQILVSLDSNVSVQQVVEKYEETYGNDSPSCFNIHHLSDVILELS